MIAAPASAMACCFIRMNWTVGTATVLALACAATAQAVAQAPSTGTSGIYSCALPDGRRLTSDRPIAECTAREQRILNADGSQRAVLPPYLSPEERAAQEAKERRLAAEQAARNDAVRRDRNLMLRFPNAQVHQQARTLALDDVKKGIEISERRIKELAEERKPLLDETEFYKGKPLPPKLKQQLDRNDAAALAQQQLIGNSRAEMVRINARYDEELARLKRLWTGSAPGSLGAMSSSAESAASSSR